MDDPESIRQRGLDAADETLHMLRQRQEEQEQRLHASGARMRPTDAPQGSAGEPEWTPLAPEPAVQRTRSVAPPQRPQQQSVGGVDWEKTGVWVHGIVNKQIEAFAKEFGEGIGEELALIRKQERELLRGELKAAIAELRTEFERRLVEAEHRAEVAELTRRLADAEQRSAPKAPARPQLVAGGSDGAD